MTYQVKIDVFEGPFDLLLTLISRQKVSIYDVPIATIAREYLTYLNGMRELDLEIASEFLLVAATLLDIKAQSLLPRETEEELEGGGSYYREAKEVLIARLLEYKKFKNVALELAGRFEAESKYYPRDVELEEPFMKLLPDYLEGIGADYLAKLAGNLIARTKEFINIIQIPLIKQINIEEKMDEVVKKLIKSGHQTFKKLTSSCQTKAEIIAVFLSVLELYKRGLLSLHQAVTFGEIEIELVENFS